MTHDSPPTRRKRRAFRVFLIILGVLMVVSILGSLTESFPSVAYSRSEGGAYERIAGRAPRNVSLTAGYTISDVNSSKQTSKNPETGYPLQLTSLSILDASGTALSSRVAHKIMDQAKGIDSLRYVDVSIPGSALETKRVGELILVVEELDSKPGWWFGHWESEFRVFLGYKPDFGWFIPATACPLNKEWSITARVRYFGSPLHRAGAVAEAIADTVDLKATIEDFLEDDEAAPPAPEAALPVEIDLGSSAEVAAATGLDGPPLLSGSRLGRKGQALWRYVGPGACERIDAAREGLEKKGWIVHDAGSRGADGKTHRVILRRGNEFAEWVYQENRETALQQESWTWQTLPNGETTEKEHNVVGPALPPAIWIHYWHEQSKEELEASMLAAGPGRADAILCLPIHQRELLSAGN